jgi:hypothetical protein
LLSHATGLEVELLLHISCLPHFVDLFVLHTKVLVSLLLLLLELVKHLF